ncbi:MAG: glycosyl transferase, partial [Candidatus Contendobacter sp.]|nr:glycosyl transferase [Candidatus Contendobacter sp.]
MPVDLAQHAQAAGGYVLAGNRYATFLTTAGAGYSVWNELTLTRWTADALESSGGFLLYLRDLDDGVFWSFGQRPAASQESRFDGGIAEFNRLDQEIKAQLEICVAPDADLELRRLTLRNASDRPRRIELTSYAELVLNHRAADTAHPAFSKLFIQTQWAAEQQALLARRRPRTAEEPSCWLVHALVGASPIPVLPLAKAGGVQYETDRARFIGRGYSLAAPRGLVTTEPLSGTVGDVLDPIVSLRGTVELAVGGEAQWTFLLGAASERETALTLVPRYQSVATIDAAFQAAARREADSSSLTAPPPFAKILSVAPPSKISPVAPPSLAKGRQEEFTTLEESTLQFWNGLGGFSAEGGEYVIRLEPDAEGRLKLPPQPWVNIIANPQFGFLSSETGAGYTWSQNSRENRLTPWFNDPVLDPHGEALYLRDEGDGQFWSLLPGPIPQPTPCEVRHGFGYSRHHQVSQGLEQEVWLFVPREDPVKITRIRLRNRRDQPCRLALFSYARLVLGALPGDHAGELAIEQDAATGALLAENGNGEFAGRIAFAAGSPTDSIPVHVTGDRAEFIGLYGSPAQPAALNRATLSGRLGAELDPCFALQVILILEPGESVEYAFLLGEAADRDEARRLIDRYREDGAIAAALTEVRAFWRDWLGAVQIETPD